MTHLTSLWLPILLAAAAAFVLSCLFWTVLPHHKKDIQYCPEQDQLLDTLRSLGIKPGNYMFPNCQDPKDWKKPESMEMFNAGPWGTLNLFPAKPNMLKNMGLTLLWFIVVSIFVGYLTSEARAPGAGFLEVFQVATTAAAVCYVFGGGATAIWFGKPLRFMITDALDGVAYAAVTGVLFAAMWPAPSA